VCPQGVRQKVHEEGLCGRLPWRKKRYAGKVFDEMPASLFAEI
jgi:hypothetical protein